MPVKLEDIQAWMSDKDTRRVAQVAAQKMASGEACNFEALRLEDTSIKPGLDAWSLFCSTADNSMLRLVIAVIKQRQDAAWRRKRLAELS